jgi:hypothetical protein
MTLQPLNQRHQRLKKLPGRRSDRLHDFIGDVSVHLALGGAAIFLTGPWLDILWLITLW